MPGVVVLNPVTAADGYGNPIGVTHDLAKEANRLLTSGVIEGVVTIGDGYGNAVGVEYDEGKRVNRLLTTAKFLTPQPNLITNKEEAPVIIHRHGDNLSLGVHDQEIYGVMVCVLEELKKIRMHLQIMTEERIDIHDVED